MFHIGQTICFYHEDYKFPTISSSYRYNYKKHILEPNTIRRHMDANFIDGNLG